MKKAVRLLVVVFSLFALGFLIWGLPRLLWVNKVDCQSQFGPCSPSLELLVQEAQGKSLHQAKNWLNQELKNESLVENFDLRFSLPDKISVVIVVRKATFAVAKKESLNYALVDKNGVVINFCEETPLPILMVDQLDKIGVGSQLTRELVFAGGLIQSLFSSYNTRTGLILGDTFKVQIKGVEVIFPLSGDKETLLGSLALILAKLDRPITLIDLRYKNPVVK
jgi:hypothetical protein